MCPWNQELTPCGKFTASPTVRRGSRALPEGEIDRSNEKGLKLNPHRIHLSAAVWPCRSRVAGLTRQRPPLPCCGNNLRYLERSLGAPPQRLVFASYRIPSGQMLAADMSAVARKRAFPNASSGTRSSPALAGAGSAPLPATAQPTCETARD